MGTVVADPTYLPTTVEHMARKQLAQAEAEKTAAAAAAAADPFQPAPSGSGRLQSAQQYAKFATQTEEWEARNKTHKDLLYEALEKHDKRRKKKYTTQLVKFQLLFTILFLCKNMRSISIYSTHRHFLP